MSLAFTELKNELNLEDYNISLIINVEDNDELYKKAIETTKLDNIENYSIKRDDGITFLNPKYNQEYIDFLNLKLNEEKNQSNITISVVGKEQYEKYIKSLGLKYEDIKDKAILYDDVIATRLDDNDELIYAHMKEYDYKVGEVISGTTSDDTPLDIEIGYITDKKPLGLSSSNSNARLILSDELFDKYFNTDYVTIYYDSSNADKLQDNIDSLLNGYNYNLNNREENARIMEKLYTLVGIFLYGFIIVITLIGITNIFNTITTNMELRKPEFAMLKSIGMTTKEFNRMVRLETVFMGVKSLLFSIPIGIGLSYIIYRSLGVNQSIEFTIPINAIVIAIIAVFLLITVIMKYSMSKINKQNTIETIRNENI
jgi:putative ABC transport system permease protein